MRAECPFGVGGTVMDDKPIGIIKELFALHGALLREDPDRLGQLLEERCGECRREIFLLTFALREMNREGFNIEDLSKTEEFQRWEERLRENLGFSKSSAEWVVEALRSIDSPVPEEGGVIAFGGGLPQIKGGIANKPRTAPLRKKAFNQGIILLAILGVFAIFFFKINASRYPAGDDFPLAFLAPLSGPGAEAGQTYLKAAQVAVDELNRQGGVAGNRLHIVGLDIPADPVAAKAALEAAMKNRHFVAMISACSGESAAAIAPIADAGEIPFITIESLGNDAIMKGANKPWLYSFHMAYGDDYYGKLFAYFLNQGLNRNSVAIIRDKKARRMNDFYESLEYWIPLFNMQVVAEGEYGRNDAGSIASALRALDGSGADALILAVPPEDIAFVVQEARKADFFGPIIGRNYSDSLWLDAGVALDGTWWITPVFTGDEQLRSFLRSYSDTYNEASVSRHLPGAVFAYDAVKWLADAFTRTQSYRGEALRHALLSTKNLRLVHATLTVDPRTHGPWNKAASLIYCSDGKGRFKKRFWPH